MKIFDLCKTQVVAISADANLQQAAILMNAKSVGCLIVVDAKNIPIGLVTDRDMTLKGLSTTMSPDCMNVRSVMTESLITITDDSELFECIDLMKRTQVRRVIVVSAQTRKLQGIISVDDIFKCLAQYWVSLSEIYQIERKDQYNHEFTKMA